MNQTAPTTLRFDDFELDEANARLTRNGQPVQLTPRAFDLLCVLARHRGRLVTRGALLDAVWGHRHVSDSTLKTTISHARAAVGDDAAHPRYIETVPRRGYRFSAAISVQAEQAPAVMDASAPPTLIGRAAAFDCLHACWQAAQAGRRTLLWITGDAGVGKTTLIDAFVRHALPGAAATGQCAEQYGAGEPYLPVLEALGALSRKFPELPALMRSIAPMWFAQLPWLGAPDDRAALQHELAGANQERMLREFLELIARFSNQQPLVLVSEDLHWGDAGTLRLMEQFARRREPVRVLWIASCRLVQAFAEEHPLANLLRELRLHRLCEEIALDAFSEAELREYFANRGLSVAAPLLGDLHRRTDGLPLFAASIADAALASGEAPPLQITGELAAVPESLAGAVEAQFSRLSMRDRTLLESACVCGPEFHSTILADALQTPHETLMSSCDELARRQYWLRSVATTSLPDGRLDVRYAFRHELYRRVLYERTPEATRTRLHRRIAEAMQAQRPNAQLCPASELAVHFELGLMTAHAVRAYNEAARSALNQFAGASALHLTRRALELLVRIPGSAERSALEFLTATQAAIASSQVYGMAAQETRAAMEQAFNLSESPPPSCEQAALLTALGWHFFGTADYSRAQRLAERVYEAAAHFDDAVLRVCACDLLGVTLPMHAGYAPARERLEEGLATWNALGEHAPYALFLADPGVMMNVNLSSALHHLGLTDEAKAHLAQARALAQSSRQPMALMFSAWAHARSAMRTHDLAMLEQWIDELDLLVTRHRLPHGEGARRWLRGWLETHRGEPRKGYEHIIAGVTALDLLGMRTSRSEVLGYAAEALLLAGDLDSAHDLARRALDAALEVREGGAIPLLKLLYGRCLLALDRGQEARAMFEEAVQDARTQQSTWCEASAVKALESCGDPPTSREDG